MSAHGEGYMMGGAMRRVTFLAALFVAVSVLLPGSAIAATGGSDLPFKGSISGTTDHNLSNWQLVGMSTGQVTHLGRSVLDQNATLQPTSPISFIWSGTWTLTAANGDQISGSAMGACSREDPSAIEVMCVIDYASSGGTGRFEDASAQFTATFNSVRVSLDPGPPTISYGEHEGTLSGHLSW
jgi:hypothetical protein